METHKKQKAQCRYDANGKVRRGASASAAFESVDEAVVPPLPTPQGDSRGGGEDGAAGGAAGAKNKRARSTSPDLCLPDAGAPRDDASEPPPPPPPRPRPRATNMPGHGGPPGADGRWNLAAATLASFPARFAKLSDARKSVRRGEVLVHGAIRRGDYRPSPGDPIVLVQRTSSGKVLDRADLPPDLPPLLVAYEDAHMAVVVKPEGVPTVGDASWTAERMLPYYLAPVRGVEGALSRPRPAHRLDLATGGLLCVAKTRRAMAALCTAFGRREPRKRYRAVLCGEPGAERSGGGGGGAADAGCGARGVIDSPLDGRPSVTRWSTVKWCPSDRYGRLTLVDMWPKTGRTHQLRRHAADTLGCPILGRAGMQSETKPNQAKRSQAKLNQARRGLLFVAVT